MLLTENFMTTVYENYINYYNIQLSTLKSSNNQQLENNYSFIL